MAVADRSDVETSLMRSLSESEGAYVDALLARAETLLLVRIPTLLERVEAEPQFRKLVVMVEAEAVARVFRNPSAYRQESEGNYSYSLNYEVASGLLDILDREWSRLGVGGGFRAIAPRTDGYLATRGGGRPDLWFQYGWPAYDDHSCGGEFRL